MTGRTIAIGDIHGCVFALNAVLDAVQPERDDMIVCLGDVIDYGRESRDVVERLIELDRQSDLIVILGNHEEMLLGALENEPLRESWFNLGGVSTVNSYRFGGSLNDIPGDHVDFIRGCREYHETETHLFVHANYDPDVELAETPAHILRWTLLDDPSPRPHQSGKTAVVGHTEQKNGETRDLGCVQCIDTNCHGYGWLTALDVHSGQVWQASRWGALREEESIQPLQRARELLHGHSDHGA